MSPLSIVGITLLTTVLADVSHVLQGQAHPPTVADPQEINNAFNAKNAKDFWWMQDDSPLKASYDYFKKCAATGKCATGKHEFKFSSSSSEGSVGPIDLQKNVFLNGNFATAGSSSSFSRSTSGSAAKAFHSGANIDLSSNPFLQGGFAHAGQEASGALCVGNSKACVPKQDCVNGVASSGATKSNKNACAENEVCCQLSSAGKSSLAEHVNHLLFTPGKSKFTGKDGLTPEQVQIIHSSQEGIRPQFNFIGESDGSSTIKPTRDITAAASEPVFSSTPDYSNVQFGNDARFSNLEGLDYLPPHPGTTTTPRPPQPPTCPPGQYLNNFGRCEPVKKPCPPGTRPTPSGGCEQLKVECPPGQKPGPYGGCIEISTQPPTRPPPQCPPGQKPGPYGSCVPVQPPSPPPTQPPRCPPGQKLGPYGSCVPVQPPSPPPTQPPLQCPPGQKPGPYGSCVPVQPPSPPPTSPPLQCPPGQKPGPYGSCVPVQPPSPPPTQPPIQCPPGQKPGPYGSCVPVQPPSPPPTQPPTVTTAYCPSGYREGPNGQCIPVAPKCGFGQRPTAFGGCEPIPTPPRPPVTTEKPKPYCPSGQREGPNGQCVPICGAGQRPTSFGGCENIPPPPPPTPRPCPPGQKPGPYGGCVSVPTPPPPSTPPPTRYCPSGQREGPNGQCITVCGAGQRPTLLGECEDIPTPPRPLPPTTPRPCPPGQKPGPYGGCIPVAPPPTQPPTQPPRCGPGQTLGPYGQCIPTQVTPTPTPTPGIYCNAGERVGPNGECIKISTCPPGQTVGPFGQCIPPSPPSPRPPTPPPSPPSTEPPCPPGQKPGPYGGCVAIRTPPPPAPPSTRPPPKTCQPGYILGAYGQCVPVKPSPPPTTRQPPYCASGQRVGPNGDCIDVTPSPQPTCRPGQKLGPYGGCVDIQRPTPPPRPTCPPGSFPTAAGGCQRPTPPPTQPPPIPCPPGTVKTPSGRCETPPPPPRPITCPPGSYLGPSGNCVRPPPPPPPTTSRTYLPPKTPTSGTPGYFYSTPTPPFKDGSNIESDLTPGRPDESPSPGGNVPVTVRPPTSPRPPLPARNTTITDDQIPVGCAAALKCVQEIYCTADGFVSPVPVVLTKEQELLRAPTTVCRDIESGTLGKCCRDRDYQDPWPSANLVNGVDDGQYAEDDSLGQYKAEYNRISRSSGSKRSRSKRAVGECGVRNLNSRPQGQVPIDADFAEISWQAMILRDTNRSLLCGGAIIRKNAVLTAAHCVEGLETSDILIKGGEWKLGIDEEPLPFQIVRVAAILRHPEFQAGSLQNDLAVLVLEENLRYSKNIGQICLPEPNLIPTQNCIATGWGKRILQLHARNALMHKIDVNIMDVQQCQQVMGEHFQKSLPNYNTNTLCGFSNIDQCKVDYGSALACADEYGRYTLSGIYAWDTGCKQQGQIGGYVAPDVDWIENVLGTPLKQLKRIDRAYNTARLQRVASK